MKTNRFIFALLFAVPFAACEENATQTDELFAPVVGQAQVKFFHFGLNAPGVNFFVDDAKVTAISSTTAVESTTGTAYSGAAAGALYTAHEPGAHTLTGRIAAATDKNLVIASLPATLLADGHYSYYMSGFYNTTAKTIDSFIVEDNLPELDFNQTCVRFVNAISNSQPMTLFVRDPVSGNETQIGGEVAYKGAGTFVCFTGGTYDLATRVAGATTNAISRTGVGFTNGRVYSVSARGDMTVTSTTATNRPFLDNTANR